MAMTTPAWTADMDEELRRHWGYSRPNAIAAKLGCTPGQVKWRAAYLHLPRIMHSDLTAGPWDDETKNFARQDERFVAAMARAIAARKENAPLGIDTRPCTKKPIFVPHRAPAVRSGSPAATCADIGD